MILLGVMLGWPRLVAAFFVAIFFGAAIGSVQLILKKGPGTPFGPYLAFGAITAALGMPLFVALYMWYMNFLQGIRQSGSDAGSQHRCNGIVAERRTTWRTDRRARAVRHEHDEGNQRSDYGLPPRQVRAHEPLKA
jgi:hypothetical protein